MGGRGANSGNSIAKGEYTYTRRGFDLAIKIEDIKGNKILARLAGKGPGGVYYSGDIVTATPDSEMIKGMRKRRKR